MFLIGLKKGKGKSQARCLTRAKVDPETDPAQEFSNSCLLKFCKEFSGSVESSVSRCEGLVRLFRCQRVLKGFKGSSRAS